MTDLKCLLVDDHVLIRDALSMLINMRHPQVKLSSAGRLGDALATLAADPEISLVLLDLQLPDSRGIDTLRQLREAAPDPRVIVLSADDSRDTVMSAIDAGAAGFIPKRADFAVLDNALRTILEGGVFIPPGMQLGESPEAVRGTHPNDPSLGLTTRQLDVFRLLIEGKSNKQIARVLALSESTVKTHLQAIFERLGISTRAQAVVVAAREGWQLPPPSALR